MENKPKGGAFSRDTKYEDDMRAAKQAAEKLFQRYAPDDAPMNIHMIPPMRNAFAEIKSGIPVSEVISRLEENILFEYFPKEYKALEQREIQEAAKAAAAMPKPKPEVLPSTEMPKRYKEGGRVKLI